MKATYVIEIEVEAERQSDVRDLGDAIREGVRRAQRGGQHPDVSVVGGPSISTVLEAS